MFKLNKKPRKIDNPCVYCIVNLITQQIYVGSTVNFYMRVNEHLTGFVRNNHYNKYLKRAALKYGINNFQFFKLENLGSSLSKKLLIEREQYYIDILKPEYNLLPNAYSHFGARRTQQCKDKISKANVMNVIYQYNFNLDLVKVHFDGCNKAANSVGIGRSSLKNALCGISETAGGYFWKKIKIKNIDGPLLLK